MTIQEKYRNNPHLLKDKPSRLALRRQLDNFSCGPASVFALWQTINYLSCPENSENHTKEEDISLRIYEECSPIKIIGTSTDSIIRAMRGSNLPIISHGENTWDESLAIANIKNSESGVGHFVLLLLKEGKNISFFDPILSDIIQINESMLDWRNSDSTLIKWSANTGVKISKTDLFRVYVEPAHFIITEADEKIDLSYDVSTAIFQRLRKDRHQVVWSHIDKIRTKNNILFIDSIRVRKNDVVWLRLDPESTVSYYETLRLLSHVDARFVNSPSAILRHHDKYTSFSFRQRPLYTAHSNEQLAKVINELAYKGIHKLALKAPSSCGGRDIYFIEENDHPTKGFDIIEKHGLVIIEPFISRLDSSNKNTDIRVLWIRNHGFVGAVSRESQDLNSLCNLTAGGESNLPTNMNIPQVLLDDIDNHLTSLEGVYLAGVDWFNDQEITEINISCPSVYLNFEELMNLDIMSIITKI